ncbi:MAG: Abi family protein [Coriobacteriales bacterium]|nr:Abi family protein [Coriobacteriales bacterium]
MPDRKPILTVEQQIAHLKNKGITFEQISKDDAADYLATKNNFLRVAAYREVFFRQSDGDSVGQYLNLDFSYLVDLASIDHRLREVMLPITLDIEHFAKVKVLDRITQLTSEDGYSIVSDFIESLAPKYRKGFENDLKYRGSATSSDLYSGSLIAKYQDDMPAWVLLEAISFGLFLTFYRFCAQRWDDQQMLDEHYLMKQVKSVRNACAHNSCIINCFRSGLKSQISTSHSVTTALSKCGVRNSKTRRAKLDNPIMQQIVATLYTYKTIVNSEASFDRTINTLQALKVRIAKNCQYYTKANALMSFLHFTERVIDIWFPVAQDNGTQKKP